MQQQPGLCHALPLNHFLSSFAAFTLLQRTASRRNFSVPQTITISRISGITYRLLFSIDIGKTAEQSTTLSSKPSGRDHRRWRLGN